MPDVETLRAELAARPVYLDRGKAGYAAVDLSPLAPLLHLFLTHYAELGALHPSDADVARLAEEALAGSTIRFADHAGILPLARSLQALSEADSFAPPAGLRAELRPLSGPWGGLDGQRAGGGLRRRAGRRHGAGQDGAGAGPAAGATRGRRARPGAAGRADEPAAQLADTGRTVHTRSNPLSQLAFGMPF